MTGDDDAEVLARYVWNICLCEALYPSLQNLEIALRNSIHSVAESTFANPNWLQDFSIVIGSKQQQAVSSAISELQQAHKPIEPGRIVAATTFGLWTGFLEARYDRVLWRTMLRPVFPHAPARMRSRHTLYTHLSDIRRLRNRVFHHEPVWSRPNLSVEHADIINTIGWINPTFKTITQSIDRFPAVNTPAYFAHIKSLVT